MKKRIISLILVVATLFLTLTGCNYNYEKDDMSKYATLDASALAAAIAGLEIEDGDFGRDEETRKQKVEDAIAAAILKLADNDDKRFDGKAEKYDALYYCYYATDAEGNIFFANQMDESKVANIQLGLLSHKDLNLAISEAILGKKGDDGVFVDGVYKDIDIKDYLYTTSSNKLVESGDYVALSYKKVEIKDDNTDGKIETADNVYTLIDKENAFTKQLIGKTVGFNLGNFDVTETIGSDDSAKEMKYSYRDVKINSFIKDAKTQSVAEGDTVYITYTKSFNVWEGFDEEAFETTMGEDLGTLSKDGKKYEYNKVEYERVVVAAKDTGDAKTLLGQLAGMTATQTKTITAKEDFAGQTGVEVTYTSTKINWIVNSETDLAGGLEVKYTPYTEKLNDEGTNKKTQNNIYGETITLNEVELTYHIFPVYVIDTAELSAEIVVNDFYSTLAKTETKEHEHSDDEDEDAHEDLTEFVFATLNDKEYKNGDKTLADLVEKLDDEDGSAEDLVKLFKTKTDKDSAVTTALKAVTTAQTNLATEESKSSPDSTKVANYKKELETKVKAYNEAVTAANEAKAKVDAQVELILAAKKGETGVKEALVKDYETYQYDTLEDAYKSELKTALSEAIFEYVEKNIKYNGTLPKKAVKDAYKAIMNTHKYDFYEGKYSSGSSSSSSSSTETNYKHYDGDFDSYLIAALKVDSVAKAEEKINKQAEDTVKDIILIYVLADAMEANGHDVELTKEEKKNLEKNLENMQLLYQQIGYTYTYNLDDHIHASQFDKIMNYLLEVDEDAKDEKDPLKVVYKNIKYDFKAEDDADSSN